MKAWQLGNTTVRSALRIRDGLIVYSQSSLQGNIRKTEGDRAFRELLGAHSIISLGDDNTQSAGRKWRSAMGKLGFLYPKVTSSWGFTQDDLGPLDGITPSGWNLIRADSVAGIQECYLRAMVVPSHKTPSGKMFAPLLWTLSLLQELSQSGLDASLSFLEFAAIVQLTTPEQSLPEITDVLAVLRTRRDIAKSKKRFDAHYLEETAKARGMRASTLRDYADENIRYLKATGMVQAKGRGIALVPEKAALAIQLTGQLLVEADAPRYCKLLCQGPDLPTDERVVALSVLRNLIEGASQYGVVFSTDGIDISDVISINQARYRLEELIFQKKEELYAFKQVDCWREIEGYLSMFAERKVNKKLANEVELRIRKEEAPAFLEWAFWRAMLAINHLINKPYEVRRFKVDQDFLPICTAPGNGPDIIAEFEDFVIVVEVTLSEGSRQEAMEGEPVRRHVAALMESFKKPVYALFVAVRVNTNTIETFRRGVWYGKDDVVMNVRVIPLSIAQFTLLFRHIFEQGVVDPHELILLIESCEGHKGELTAPEWRSAIESAVIDAVSKKQ